MNNINSNNKKEWRKYIFQFINLLVLTNLLIAWLKYSIRPLAGPKRYDNLA
jgi:hypothetical protein